MNPRALLARAAASGPGKALRRRVEGSAFDRSAHRAFEAVDWAVWRLHPVGPPPRRHKVRILREHASRHGLRALVETGTYEGDTIADLARDFDHIWSIEMSPTLHEQAARRFADDPHVTLLLGDSARVLPEVVAKIAGPALFWLDAHWSEGRTARGDTDSPVVDELRIVLARGEPRDVVLVDDAREFTGRDGYPTIETVRDRVRAADPTRSVEVVDDIIRILPGS